MNTRKIKVKLVDRPATLICSFLEHYLVNDVLIVTVKIFGDLCLDIPIKCTLWFEKNIAYLTSGLYWFPLDISSRIDGESNNDRFLT